MAKFKLHKNDAGEVEHKLTIVTDEPDLQEDYGITQEQADALLASVPRKGGVWEVTEEWALKVVYGEMQDHVKVLRNIAENAWRDRETNQARNIERQASKFARMFKPTGYEST